MDELIPSALYSPAIVIARVYDNVIDINVTEWMLSSLKACFIVYADASVQRRSEFFFVIFAWTLWIHSSSSQSVRGSFQSY